MCIRDRLDDGLAALHGDAVELGQQGLDVGRRQRSEAAHRKILEGEHARHHAPVGLVGAAVLALVGGDELVPGDDDVQAVLLEAEQFDVRNGCLLYTSRCV